MPVAAEERYARSSVMVPREEVPLEVKHDAVESVGGVGVGVFRLEERLVRPGTPQCTFFTAVRLLEQLAADAPRVGGDGPLLDEALYFRHSVSFSSQPNELSSIQKVDVPIAAEQALERKRTRYEVKTCFLGLSGADSPLPLFYAEDLVYDDEWSQRQAYFLDVFHNRLTALFYRAVSRYHYPKECLSSATDPASARALALAGVDTQARRSSSLTTQELMRLSGLFAFGGSTARSIENSLRVLVARELAGAALKLTQFCGGWVHYDASQTNRLGRANHAMAQTFMLGTRVLHPAHRARVTVGPMPAVQAVAFGPGQPSFVRIRDLVYEMCGDPIEFELEVLVQDDYPPFVLGRRNLGVDVYFTTKRESERVSRRTYNLDR